ncbi:hypothetical protein DSO57_1010978 [Entomophthora muscae]|uniref:Uncharacterized protein n=1 Tax=Entomophthora muscae TaxID=34485 RepID=A0ACC2UFA0_9FUNG|nr:hypothetical protein DSO57_1010978 [Entomophthora muscae]
MRSTTISPPSASPSHQTPRLQAHLGMIQSPAPITSLAFAMLLLAPGTLCWPTTSAIVRIDNSSSLETWAWEQGSNPEPGPPWAAGPVDCGTACPLFFGIKPPQADTERTDPCSKNRQTKEIITPNEGLITAPNGGTDLATISFINLKSTPETNQEKTQKGGTGLQPGPMTSTPEQDNQAAKSRFLTNERTPGPGAILPPLDPSTQFPQPWSSHCSDEPPMENVKFGGGYYIDPRTPHSKLITIFE